MPTYHVTIPIVGTAYVTIEAENREAAIDAALDSITDIDQVEEWEAVRYVSRGNVCYAPTREADAERADGEDEDDAGGDE